MAIKRIYLNKQIDFSISEILNEIKILKTSNHPNIIKFYDYIEDHSKISIIMEFADKGKIKEILLFFYSNFFRFFK